MPENIEDAPEPAAFGKYLLDAELARGGMSRVFRARLRGPGGFEKKLVVKQILPELAADPEFVKLFVKEANTLVQLSHPNLVPVYELGVVDGVYFLAMEWVQGATVDELLRDQPLPAALVAQIGAQVADALQYAHERFQIVHRDVTPRNVIVDGAGHARLLDFGIAARVEHTGHGELFGSPGYMAPEQLRGEALGPRADLFSLGCVLHEAASGKPAWPLVRSARELAEAPPPPPLPELDASLAALIESLLAREPAARPAAASEVAGRLRTWLAEHNPRGVQAELAERVLRVASRSESEPRPHSEAPRASSGRIEVRSIAVSKELSELLSRATERLERPTEDTSQPTAPRVSSLPPPDLTPFRMSEDPEAHRVARRFLRDLFFVTLALLFAIFYARSDHDKDQVEDASAPEPAATPLKPDPAPQPLAPTPEPPPPTAAGAAPAEAVPAAAPAAEEEPAAASDAGKKSAYLSVSAVPWAEVRVDGRLLGTTPRRSLPVRAGKHALSLSCPPLAHEAKLDIELTAGKELRVRANMHESPPDVQVQPADAP
jgi:serine/threonine-protein kinase